MHQVVAIAERQHGVLTRKQLLSLGVGERAIPRWVRVGRLHRIYPGVYSIGHRLLTHNGSGMAACLACGDGAALSHRSAAGMWRLLAHDGRSWDVTVPRGSGGRSGPRGVRVHHSRGFSAAVTTVRQGVPVTTIERTLLDLAGAVSAQLLQRAVHEAEVLRLLNVSAVQNTISDGRGRGGTKALAAAIGVSAPDPDNSEFVHRFLVLCKAHGLPPPSVKTYLDSGRPTQTEVDILFHEHGVIVELDGAAVHMTRKRFEEDRRRDAALLARGYVTLRFTWRRLTEDSDNVAAEIHAVLVQRTAGGTDQ